MTARQRQLRHAFWRGFGAVLIVFTLFTAFALALDYADDEQPAHSAGRTP
jgi:LPS O-antigen subunit length determinant protein (WzzB/FepE family)